MADLLKTHDKKTDLMCSGKIPLDYKGVQLILETIKNTCKRRDYEVFHK